MIDNWFNSDIEKIHVSNDIVVFIDGSKEARFLADTVDKSIKILETSNEIEELNAKFEIEKNVGNGTKYLIYTWVPKDRLKFIREYCETNGCIEIKYLDHYLKKKVN